MVDPAASTSSMHDVDDLLNLDASMMKNQNLEGCVLSADVLGEEGIRRETPGFQVTEGNFSNFVCCSMLSMIIVSILTS